MSRIIFNPSTGNIEPVDNVTSPLKPLGEKLKLTGGNPLPEDPTKPVNPWAPKPIGPVLPNKKLASLTNMNTPDLEQSPDSFLRPGETLEDWDVTFRRANAYGGLQRTGFADGPEKKYITPLRRKFDGRKFDSVPDPTYSDGRRRVKTKAYKKWLKEQHALPKPKYLYTRTVRPELDNYLIEIAEAMREADNTQDFEYLMRNKEATKKLEIQQAKSRKKGGKKVYKQRVYPKGMLSLDALKVLETLETDPVNLKIIADSLDEDVNWVLQILDERNQYVEDVKGERALAKDDPKYKKPRNDYLKVENWLQKNAKRYSTPQAFEKALIKRFGNKNQFVMDMKKGGSIASTYFSDGFKKLMLNSDPGSPVQSHHLRQLISSSLYNYNDKIKAQLTDEIKKIFTSENLPKLRTEARKMIKNNPLFKMFGLDKTITGPFPRVIQGVIGEKLWKDFRAFRHPRVNTYELLKAFEDLVPKEFKGIFKESARAVLDAQQNKWPEAKKKLGIADKIAWDHKIPSSIIDKGYADIIEYTKVNPVNYEWNSRIKNAKFDTPLNRSIKKFEKAKTLSAKKKIVEDMISDKNKFSKNWGGYLDEIDINFNEKTGQLKFSSSAKPLDTKANTVEMLKKSISQIEKKYKPVIQSRLNSGIPLDDIFQRIAVDLNLPVEQIKNVAGKTLRGLGKAAIVADPVFMAFDEKRATDRGAGALDTAEYVVDSFFQGVLNLPDLVVSGAKWGKGKLSGKDTKFETGALYEPFTFAEKELEKNLSETPMKKRVRNLMGHFASAGGYKESKMEDPEYVKIFESLSDEELKKRLEKEDEERKYFLKESEFVKDKFNQEFATGGRVGFADGTSHDDKSDEEILEWIKNQMFEMEQGWNTGKSIPGKILDVARVDNWPYYAARMLRAGMNVAEVSAKLPFVSIDLLQKLATRPAFKLVDAKTSTGDPLNKSVVEMGMSEKYMQGFDDSWLTDQPQKKLKGTGLFTEAFKNLMPGAFSEKTGLDSLIEGMEEKMIAQGQSKWPTIAGKNIEMGLDITLPFGYVMAANKYNALKKSLAPFVAGKSPSKVIEEALTERGMNRRDFNKLLVTGGAIGALKYLGLDKLLKGVARNPIPGPIKMIERSTTKMPVWFPKFIDKINDKMTYHGDGMWSFTGTDDFLPGFHIERIGDDYHISGKNSYEQDFQITYESPKWEGDADGSFYNQGEFVVEDSVPVKTDPDGNVDWDSEVVDELHNVLGGTKELEEIGTGQKVKEMTKGEIQVDWAEGRAQSAYDEARDAGEFDVE